MPTRARDWPDVLAFIWPWPKPAVDIQVRQEACNKQSGWRSIRTKRDGGSYAFVEGLLWAPMRA